MAVDISRSALEGASSMTGGETRFDVAVVGAGPAGTTCALLLARAGLEVALIERGPYPGSKNTFGGVLYRHPLEQIVPRFWERAPIERKVIDKQYWLLTEDSAVKLGHRSRRFAEEPYNTFTVLRAKFDRWYAEEAREAGAMLIPSTVALEAIRDERGRVIGVRTDREQGDLYASVVVAADGVNSLLSRQLGLHGELRPEHVALGVKEVIALGEDRIRERFNLEGDEGADISLLGAVTKGMVGGGFIYTNRDTVSVGVVANADAYRRSGNSPVDLLEEMKAHPLIRPLLEGGQLKEYQAHLIPEGGFDAMPPLCADGLLVVGDAASLVNAAFFEGSNHAILSGQLAAETILEAKSKGDFSAQALAGYERRLRQSVTLRDLKGLRRLPGLLHSHPQYFAIYPELLNEAAHHFLAADGRPKRDKVRGALKAVTARRSPWQLLRDLWDVWRGTNLWP